MNRDRGEGFGPRHKVHTDSTARRELRFLPKIKISWSSATSSRTKRPAISEREHRSHRRRKIFVIPVEEASGSAPRNAARPVSPRDHI